MSNHTDEPNSVTVTDLRVEYEAEPNNVVPDEPRFSWQAEGGQRGEIQTAYQVLVARSKSDLERERAGMWDSGKIEATDSTNVPYDGVPLDPGTDYYWTVRIWNGADEPSEWAQPATFSTALVEQRDWEGTWIGYQPDGGDSNGYRSHWHSADADAEEWVQVDLGAEQEIEQVELYPADPFDGPQTPDGMPVSSVYPTMDTDRERAAGFGFPIRYRITVSDDPDFENARTVVDRTDEDQDNQKGDPIAVSIDSLEAQYVRVTATDLYEFDPADPPLGNARLNTDYVREERRSWQTFALAALSVRDADDRDLAMSGSVTASSSVEEAAWGREKLVDGHYVSQMAPQSPLLRTEVDLGGDIERARAHVCGLGYGELYVNGECIGEEVLNPGWTQYDERILYSSYDVSDQLESGENALGLWLGQGWFGRNAGDWTGFGSPRAILQLEIEYVDGTTRTVSTDSTWNAAPSPLVENDLYDGERYDAREERDGWAQPGFDDSDWVGASIVTSPGGDLVPQRTPPIRVTETITPVEVLDREEGPILDFGQNLVGWLELTIDGADAGDEIELRHAEVLLEDGSLALEDLRSADATDTYIAKGDGTETYEPRFTYHGFRYAQVLGYPGDLNPEDVRAKVVHTDVESVGEFDCSNEELSQVQQNAQWGLRGNLHSVLTDCPQRDERFGWTGDNHIAARALCYNFDASLFYEKWMDDHADIRSEHGYIADTIPYGYGGIPEDPTWGVTQVTVPWHLYRHYGDIGVLERHYEGMRKYVDFWQDESDGGIVPDEYGTYGDWLAFENKDPELSSRGLPRDLFNTAFQYHTTDLFAEIANVLGHEDDARRYASRAETVKSAFNDEFFDADAAQYGPGTQSSYAVPLYFGLVPDEHVDAVVDNLVEKVRGDGGKLQTGFLGTRPLIHTLVDHGFEEVAYEIVSQPERPGWVYMIRQNATTMWERWDSDDRIGDGMNSFNHSPFNFVSEWFYYALAGLRFDDSMHGRGSVEVAPAIVDDLDWAAGHLETVSGRLASRWERTDDGLAFEIEIPWNTTATVRLPGGDGVIVAEDGTVFWDGDQEGMLPAGVEEATLDDGDVTLTVGSGVYEFVLEN
ncbi:family 78 glycoside hydrolase catalytic domain [Halocatena marina]|uniref:family 78 glycoside hydrolase catalytic domain n=1 Tax=Halocatena marina TaxID=2934937 RepID=UPI0022252879|nr:family 78 glycoside hydrolase catalytic domain [Halocatena marina]